MNERSISIIVADGQPFLRSAIAEWIARRGNYSVVAEVGDGAELVAAAIRHRPDIVWLDMELPGQSAIAAAMQIKKVSERTRVILCSGSARDREIGEALAAKTPGVVTKIDVGDAVADALRTVALGGTYVSPTVRARMASTGAETGKAKAKTRSDALTTRELEVLQYVAKGMSKRTVAELMFISPRTVERHVANIMSSLDIHDRVELTRFAIREGLVEA